MVIALITFLVAMLLVDLPVEHPLVLIIALLLVGFFFSQLGVLVGIRAEQFEDVSFVQTFVLTPLIFLGGVFYSAALLPQPFQSLTEFNPLYYMISLVRYGFLGIADIEVWISMLVLAVITFSLFLLNLRLFQRGYKLRS
jgi:ABC-2 type transport system permease protein